MSANSLLRERLINQPALTTTIKGHAYTTEDRADGGRENPKNFLPPLAPNFLFCPILLHYKYNQLSHTWLSVYFSTKAFFQMKPRLALGLSKGIFSKQTQHNYMNNLKAEFYQLAVKRDVRDSKRGKEGVFCCLPEDGGSHVSGAGGKCGGAENRPWMTASQPVMRWEPSSCNVQELNSANNMNEWVLLESSISSAWQPS